MALLVCLSLCRTFTTETTNQSRQPSRFPPPLFARSVIASMASMASMEPVRAGRRPSARTMTEEEARRRADDNQLRRLRYEIWLRRKWLVLLRAREQPTRRPSWDFLERLHIAVTYCEKFSDVVLPRPANVPFDGDNTQLEAASHAEEEMFRQLVLKVVTVEADLVFRTIVAYY